MWRTIANKTDPPHPRHPRSIHPFPDMKTALKQRFLINAVVDNEPNAPLTVVTNWAAGVKR
ncbi:MAG TPA: hypothetical protein VKG02_06310 [Blastocatellia bacterium]|nr:hypothetical protein [Blastocatellia bacterium]